MTDKKLEGEALLDAWITALRSGRYPQTQGCLRDAKGFCCLGVLEDVAGATWVEMNEEEALDRIDDPSLPAYCANPADDESDFLTNEGTVSLSRKYFPGLSLGGVINEFGDEWTELVNLNDERGFTFEQIADAIERNRDVILGRKS